MKMEKPKTDPERSAIMRSVKSKDTAPEMQVRRLVFSLGFRYRLHRTDLPGKPDLVFPKLKKVIFVHGCFWHGHRCARGNRIPINNREYWIDKIEKNKRRDRLNSSLLQSLGWQSMVIWECSLKKLDTLNSSLVAYLNG